MKILIFWLRYVAVELLYGLAFFVGIFLFPIAYLCKYELKTNAFSWFLNSTEDGDYGAAWWRNREGIEDKDFWVAMRWWYRNPTWDFRMLLKPKWTGDVFHTYTKKNTLEDKTNALAWATRDDGIYGTNHVYYIVDGTLYGRYSHAAPGFEFQAGSGGDMWRFRVKVGKNNAQKN